MSTNVAPARGPLHLTYALMLFGFGSISSARVALSLYALELGASPARVGLVVSTLYVFPLLLSWPIGRYADRVGSRALLLFGAAVGACAMSIPYFVREMSALYIAGTMLGISFALYNVLLQNVVGLLSAPKERARNFSNASLMGATSAFSGPMLAGIAIDYAGHAAACLWLVMLSVIAGVLLAVWGGRLPGGTGKAGPSAGMRGALTEPAMLKILATSSLVQLGQDLFQFYIPVYGYGIGLSASAIGGVLATFAAASFVVRFIMPRLVARFGDETVLRYSFCLAAVGFMLVPFFHSVFALSVISFMFGLGMGCGQPITTMMIFSRSAEGRSG
ncbi:MAG TPA: MFS transporter, partial [Burkholderiales bacterium]|nr:MFS transporter [Burkholderiales bacterium]